MSYLRRIIFAILLVCCLNLQAENVFIIANKNSSKSIKLANDYCKLRSISPENILAIDVKEGANISRGDYELKIANALFKFLKERGAIKDVLNSENPEFSLISQNNVDYIVIVKGVPYRILEEPKDAKTQLNTNNSACVDSELTLLLKGKYELRGMQKNPLFGLNRNKSDYKKGKFLAVSRLDGATYSDALNIVKSSIIAEEKGLRGRAYIDLSKKYQLGDKWLLSTKEIIESLGFDITFDENPPLLNYFYRFDAPAFYFGWYSDIPRYYPSSKDVQYPNGASALHIYSFSAQNLSNPKTWTPSFIARNAAVAFGYINEPYLYFTHRSDIYMHYISRGFNVGEASFYAMNAFSWKGILLADPLFAPFKRNLIEQLKDIENGVYDELSQYAVIRQMNLILLEKKSALQAIKFGETFADKLEKKYALNWKLSQLYNDLGDAKKAITLALKSAEEAKFNFQNFGLIFEIADFLKSKNLKEKSANLIFEILNSTTDTDFLKKTIPTILKNESFKQNERKILENKLNVSNKK